MTGGQKLKCLEFTEGRTHHLRGGGTSYWGSKHQKKQMGITYRNDTTGEKKSNKNRGGGGNRKKYEFQKRQPYSYKRGSRGWDVSPSFHQSFAGRYRLPSTNKMTKNRLRGLKKVTE